MIDLGVQPLRLSAGLVMELISRDQVLGEALAAAGVRLRIHRFTKGVDVNLALHDGTLDGGVAGDMPAVAACVRDQIQVAGLVDLEFTSVVTRAFHGVAELRGEPVGVVFGSSAHNALLQALAAGGLAADDVTLVFEEHEALRPALAAGRINAFAAREPFPGLAEAHGEGRVIHRVMSSGYLYFQKSFLEAREDWVRLILAAQVRALGWLDGEEGNSLLAAEWLRRSVVRWSGVPLELTGEEIVRLVRRGLAHLGGAPLMPQREDRPEGRLGRAAAFLAKIGQLPALGAAEGLRACVQRQPLLAVLADPRRFQLDRFRYRDRLEEGEGITGSLRGERP